VIQQNPVLRVCISCRKTFNRKDLLKITKDYKEASCFKREWGDQLTFASQKNATQIPRSKKSFKKL